MSVLDLRRDVSQRQYVGINEISRRGTSGEKIIRPWGGTIKVFSPKEGLFEGRIRHQRGVQSQAPTERCIRGRREEGESLNPDLKGNRTNNPRDELKNSDR